MKFLRDPARIVATFIFPVIFIAALGGSLQANLGSTAGYDFLAFVFTGVFAQTIFQSAASGIISLIQDRENDFSQELFISPVSRYAIVFGKICGESLVALAQGLAIVVFGIIVGVPLAIPRIIALLPVAVVVSLFGGAFGVLVLSNLKSQQAADQVFTFIMLPQFFLAGVFNPIQVLPFYLDVLSRISPLRYAVDLARTVYYAGSPDYPKVVLGSLLFNVAVIAALFAVFLVVGTILFVRGERNR
ncbi:MAG: ABC transporter permease [Anaerolineae bacterium]|nr:ABC transporter permease [Anaerolineae bacterium]